MQHAHTDHTGQLDGWARQTSSELSPNFEILRKGGFRADVQGDARSACSCEH